MNSTSQSNASLTASSSCKSAKGVASKTTDASAHWPAVAHIHLQLGKLFQQADDRYNSGLFHFKAEKGRHESPDELTLGLALDDKLLTRHSQQPLLPRISLRISALPADMLGQVYEQFLGKVIRLTEGHHARVDDKPEVKKAGGVYYTPTYIVEYIVGNIPLAK